MTESSDASDTPAKPQDYAGMRTELATAARTDDRNLVQQMVNDARDAYSAGSATSPIQKPVRHQAGKCD